MAGDLVPPHNLEAEQALYGAIFTSPRAFADVVESVRPEHFCHDLHALIWRACMTLHARGMAPTPVTLRPLLEGDPMLAAAGGMGYLAALADAVVTVVNAADYAETIRDCWRRREMMAVLQDGLAACARPALDDTATRVQERIEAALFALADRAAGPGAGGFRPLADGLADALAQAERAARAAADGGVVGLTTGFRAIDQRHGGLHAGDLVILAGRPAMGKTALAVSMAVNGARALRDAARAGGGRPPVVGFFSLEMGDAQLAGRVLAGHAGVPAEAMRTGRLTGRDLEGLELARRDLEGLPLWVDDTPALGVASLRARARRLASRQGLAALWVDYIGLSHAEGAENRTQELAAITRGLKALAKELNVPVIALSQLSRRVEEREDKRPLMSDLRESGAIEQDADSVMFVYRHAYYLGRLEPQQRERETPEAFAGRCAAYQAQMDECRGAAEIITAKNRFGPVGTDVVGFDAAAVRFTDRLSE